MPMPMMMPPRSWLAAVFGLITRPQSNDPSQRDTRTSPESSRTRTSQNCAPYEPIEYFIVSRGIDDTTSAST
jgi:hypothetical protein